MYPISYCIIYSLCTAMSRFCPIGFGPERKVLGFSIFTQKIYTLLKWIQMSQRTQESHLKHCRFIQVHIIYTTKGVQGKDGTNSWGLFSINTLDLDFFFQITIEVYYLNFFVGIKYDFLKF